jgi:hypothetical protein
VASAVNSLPLQSRPAGHSGGSCTAKWSKPRRHSRLLSAPRVASRRPTTSLLDGCGRFAPRCFVPTRSNADSGSSYGANRCELRRTPSVLRARARAVRGSRLPVRVEPVAGALCGSVLRVPSADPCPIHAQPLRTQSSAGRSFAGAHGSLGRQPITPGGPSGCASSTLGEDRDHTAGCAGSGMLRGQTFGDGMSCGTWSLARPDAVGCPLGGRGRGPLLRRPRVGLLRRAAGRIYPAASITSAVDRRRSQFWAAAERMDTSGEDQPA